MKATLVNGGARVRYRIEAHGDAWEVTIDVLAPVAHRTSELVAMPTAILNRYGAVHTKRDRCPVAEWLEFGCRLS